MDYIHTVLIAEDDLDDLNKEATVPAMTEWGKTEQSRISASSPESGPSSRLSISWCKCRVCEIIPQKIENKTMLLLAAQMCDYTLKVPEIVLTLMFSNSLEGKGETTLMIEKITAIGHSEG